MSRPLTWRLFLGIVGLAIGGGVLAFSLTWLVLSWPTLVARLGWTLDHIAGTSVAVLAPAVQLSVTTDHLVIPTIHVDAPVFYNTTITDAVGKLPDGVVHVQNTAEPGQIGNAVIVGHSSGNWWHSGAFTQVFVLLDKLQTGDRIYLNRAGDTFVYAVVSREIVPPTAIDGLTQPTDRHELSLITCSPVGTTLNRLIIHATLESRD